MKRQEPLDEFNGARVQYSSKDAEALRRARDVASGREWARFANLIMIAAVLYLGVMTMAAGRWTRSKHATETGFTTVSRVNATYALHTDIGFWEVCECALTAEKAFFCSAQRSTAQAQAAMAVVPALLVVAAFVLFALEAFVLDDPWWVSYVIAGCYGLGGACLIAAWGISVGRLTGKVCGGSGDDASIYGVTHFLRALMDSPPRSLAQSVSYKDAGLVLSWGFAFMLLESIAMVVLCVMFILRGRGVLRIWQGLFAAVVILPIFVIVSTSTNYSIASPRLSSTGDVTINVGPWGACSCIAAASRCGDLADAYRAVQAFAVIRLLFQVAQIALVAVVLPVVGSAVPRWAVPIAAWCTWATQLICWTVAVGTFSACGCGEVHAGQSFDWPFAFDFLAFFVQTLAAAHLTWRYARRRLLEWAVREHKAIEAAQAADSGAHASMAAGNAVPPTSAPYQRAKSLNEGGTSFNPYGSLTDSDDDGAATASGRHSDSPSPGRFTVRRSDPHAEAGPGMAPRVVVVRRKPPGSHGGASPLAT
jgi:hypothetical protein